MALQNDDPVPPPYQPATYPQQFDVPVPPQQETPYYGVIPYSSPYTTVPNWTPSPTYGETLDNPIQPITYLPPSEPATSQQISGWVNDIKNQQDTSPSTFSGYPNTVSSVPQGSTPPNIPNDAMNLFLGGGQSPVPVNLGSGNTGWYNPNDPHPEVAFAKQHFDTAGWTMQDWIRNSMRYFDVNDKNYYFRPGQPYGNPAASRPLSGGAPLGSGTNIGGQGYGVSGGQPSVSSPLIVSNAVSTPPLTQPMVTNAVPTVNVAGDLSQLEIPDELWALIPEQLRTRFGNSLMQWLRSMGYSGKGNIGRYGERSYQRPPEQTSNVWFTPEMFGAFADPDTAKWARWLLGERGFTARISAPEGLTTTPPQG